MGVWGFIVGAVFLLLILVVIGFLLGCGYIYYLHLKYDHIPGPPRDNIILGHLPSLMKMMRNNQIVYDPFFEWIERYGPVIRLNALHKVMIWVISPEGVKEFLLSPRYTKDDFYDVLHSLFGARFMGKSLLADQDYNHWHKQRRIMDPAFSKGNLLESLGIFNEKAEELMDKLTEKADWKNQIGLHNMMNRVTLDVIAKVAFDMDLNAVQDDQTPFPKTISTVMRGMVEARDPLSVFYPSKQSFIKEVKKSLHFLRETGKECIERRVKAMQDGEDVPKDILTQILKGSEVGDGCTMEDLIDNFVTFFIAGQETTANQLSFCLMELGRNPEVLARLQVEVDEVMGSKRDIQYEDLRKLKYLSQVLKETLRLYPTAPGTSRWSESDIVIEGHMIPRGSHVMLNTYILSRMEKYFPDPLVFNPDRFHPDAPKPAHVYFPFSLGPRTCIGQVFAQHLVLGRRQEPRPRLLVGLYTSGAFKAVVTSSQQDLMEAKVVIAKFVQRFEFELVEGQSYRILDTGTLRPLDGVICRLRPRAERKTLKK